MSRKKFLRVSTKRLNTLKERRIKGKRHWENHEGNVFPSVTTVLSIIDSGWVKEWKDGLGNDVAKKIKKEVDIDDDLYNLIVKHSGEKTGGLISGKSMSIGTKAHSIIEDYLSNKKENPYAELYPMAHFNNLKEHLDDIDRIRVLEANLYSNDLGIAGKVDCIADYKGKKSVIDFKTSSKLKDESDMLGYILQVTAYTLMWNELQHDDIQQGVIMMSGGDGKKVYLVKINDHVKTLKETIKLYKEKNYM